VHEFSNRVFFKNKCWAAIYNNIFEDNVFIGNSAIELINNLLLNQEVYQKVLTSDGFKGQIKQLYSVADGYTQEGLKEYTEKTVPPDHPVDFRSHLTKLKTMMGILCIIDDSEKLMMELSKQIKISTLASVFHRVKDKAFIDDLTMKMKFLADNLMKKKDLIKLDPTVTEYIRELSPHFTPDQMKILIHIFG
jgi:hypothetical protein